ncbi:MAG: guanylate kinase [Armatimonadetes bacterium]|nr:MAG: guanylate kinase [Armatimonadota bacterium]
MNASPKGRLIVISGPSGVGKSSIVDAVLARTDARFSVSATTREPRPGEVEGSDYAFLTRDEFIARRDGGDILEWAEYGGNLYGTPRDAVLALIDAGIDVILDIENEGAKQIRAAYPEALMVFVRPPGIEDLARRLKRRGDTSQADVERRLGVAGLQMAEADTLYDHVVVNDDLADAITEVIGILNKVPDQP